MQLFSGAHAPLLLSPTQQFLIFTEMNLCPAYCLPLKGRTSDRFAVLDLF